MKAHSGRQDATEKAADSKGRRPYEPPKILSSERLEAAAATCKPQTGPYGKEISPLSCQILGS